MKTKQHGGYNSGWYGTMITVWAGQWPVFNYDQQDCQDHNFVDYKFTLEQAGSSVKNHSIP